MGTRSISVDSFDSSRPTFEIRSSQMLTMKTNRKLGFRSHRQLRRSTFAVVAQGFHFLRRKAPLHKLDRLARLIFPLLFFICNVIYWSIFVFYRRE